VGDYYPGVGAAWNTGNDILTVTAHPCSSFTDAEPALDWRASGHPLDPGWQRSRRGAGALHLCGGAGALRRLADALWRALDDALAAVHTSCCCVAPYGRLVGERDR
jgi:hypothetical protein